MSRHFTLQEVSDLELSAVEAERERIIKILEEYLADYHINGSKDIPELIELIKGEQK